MVFRTYVEKRQGLAPECEALLTDCRDFLGVQGLRAALITLVLIWGLGWALKRTLGGQTGDTLGAAIELGELLFLLALL